MGWANYIYIQQTMGIDDDILKECFIKRSQSIPRAKLNATASLDKQNLQVGNEFNIKCECRKEHAICMFKK